MAIEEGKIKDLIEAYEGYQEDCASVHSAVARGREALYKTVIADLKKLLPRKTLEDLNIDDYGELTGIVVEYGGRRGILLGASVDMVMLFTFADTCVVYADPTLVYPLDEERIWDETGVIL